MPKLQYFLLVIIEFKSHISSTICEKSRIQHYFSEIVFYKTRFPHCSRDLQGGFTNNNDVY